MKISLQYFFLLFFFIKSNAQELPKCGELFYPPQNRIITNYTSLPTPPGNSYAVGIFVQTTYTIYQRCNYDTAKVRLYVDSIFTEKQKAYKADEIIIYLDSIGYQTSINDPYESLTNSSSILIKFSDFIDSIQPTSDLSQLWSLSPYNLGGVSYVGGMGAGKRYTVSYCNIYGWYNFFPLFSWTIEVSIHETGHSLNSQHTQWCGWQLNDSTYGPIDTCWTTEGSCYYGSNHYIFNGTYMSYCHLNGAIDFTKGFGPLPRQTIKDFIFAVYLNGKLKNPFWSPVIACDIPIGYTNSITKTTAFLNWNSYPNPTKYRYIYKEKGQLFYSSYIEVFSNGAILTGLNSNTNYKWKVRAFCNNKFTKYSNIVNFKTLP